MSHIARGRNGPCVHQGGKSNQRQTSQSHCYRKHFTEFTFQLRQFNYIIIVTVNGTKKGWDGSDWNKKVLVQHATPRCSHSQQRLYKTLYNNYAAATRIQHCGKDCNKNPSSVITTAVQWNLAHTPNAGTVQSRCQSLIMKVK